MKTEKQQPSFINIGSASLMVIFLVLTLVTFAVLSLSGARSDQKLSERLAAHKTQYYAADLRAEEITGSIDNILAEQAALSFEDFTAYLESVKKELDGTQIDGCTVTCDFQEEPLLLFSVPVSDRQKLEVRLRITDFTQEFTYYKIQTWQILSDESWEGDQSVRLLPMGD